MSLKPWREVAIPHEDVLKGTFQQAEFAADLSRVHDGTASDEYQNATLFFERTYITEGMRLLLESVIQRLTGIGGEPVIQLQTAFGGGKTHTMLAVYHLVSGNSAARDLQGVSSILDATTVTELPSAKIVVLDGINISASQPRERGNLKIHTLWGELAWQLGSEEAYEQVRDSDLNGTSPSKSLIAGLLAQYSPCVILVDELVAYLRQFEQGKTYTGGSFDSNLTFIQALTEALKAVPNAILLASLPESKMEVGSVQGQIALDALEKSFGRVQALWKPVGTEEAFEIVRRRLFVRFSDTQAVETVCREFADYYIQNDTDFPNETIESRYFERLKRAYPIHPEVFDRLYLDWSTLDKFQRTRGVLKLMAKVIHRLWKDDNKDALIMPGSLPLYDFDVRNEAINYLPQGWDPVIDKDVDGERAETTLYIDNDSRFGAFQAARRTARTIFLGSAPSTGNQMVRGLELSKVILGCAQPGQQIAVYKDALHRLTDRLHYLNTGNGRYWFDTRPNLRREMEERKRRFDDERDVFPVMKAELQKTLDTNLFDGVHVFAPSSDVPDDYQLRLVVLPPTAQYSRTSTNIAIDEAMQILKTARSGEPRHRQNRLIFLAADYDGVNRLKELIRRLLAWQSIVQDIKDSKLNLDQIQRNHAEKNLDETTDGLRRMVREAFKWLLVPLQEVRSDKTISEIQWETIGLATASKSLSSELEQKLREHELLISDWSPIHLSNILKAWFWKDSVEVGAQEVWQKIACYLYFPKLRAEDVYRRTVSAGASSTDFFAFAYGKDEHGKYQGLNFGIATATIPLDADMLLIEPASAAAAQEAEKKLSSPPISHESPEPKTPNNVSSTLQPTASSAASSAEKKTATTSELPSKTTFYATTQLSTLKAKIEFTEIVDEIIQKFAMQHATKLSIKIEISAENSAGFDEKIQRDIRENCAVLKFRSAEFE